jgi:hypothetical protein
MSGERNQNIIRGSRSTTLCRFISKPGGCRAGTKCTFSHDVADVTNWREKADLSPEDAMNEEVNNAVDKGNLDELFKKMESSAEVYNKYYRAVEFKFYKVSVWKLSNMSISKNIFKTITTTEIKLGDKELPHGYMPICLHFLFCGLAANMYNEAECDNDIRRMNDCFDEIIDYISSEFKENYKDLLMNITKYYNPIQKNNVIDTLIYYLANKIMYEFKIGLGQSTFDSLMNKKNLHMMTGEEYFNNRTIDSDALKIKINRKFEKIIRSSRDDNKIKNQEKCEFLISDIEQKIALFKDTFFVKKERVKKLFGHLKPIDRFNNLLKDILKGTNPFGIPCNHIVLGQLFSLIKHNFNDTKEDKINIILSKLPKNLLNSDQLVREFKSSDNISFLWMYIKNSIKLDNILSVCPPVLYEFFKDENRGIRAAYIGEYMAEFDRIYTASSATIRLELIEVLSKAEHKFDFIIKLY